MAAVRIVILGCGYTGKRVARALVDRNYDVIAVARHTGIDVTTPSGMKQLSTLGDPRTALLYSLPSIGETDLTAKVMQAIGTVERVVYLSTTGVYGEQCVVNERSHPKPQTARERLRVEAEQSIRSACSNALILRPAAIYGPFRGVHTGIRAGTYRLAGNGTNFVSRIHVDDLAAHCVAGLLSDLQGHWPVADEHPCTSREIAEFCADLLGTSLPPSVSTEALSETRRADRRVDGSAIRTALNICLRYPSYRAGIPACIEAESAEEVARNL